MSSPPLVKTPSRRLNPAIIRVGDRVVIESPEVVVRVGYPLGINDGVAHILANHGEDVRGLIGKVTGGYDLPDYLHDKVVRQLAYLYLRAKHFGGPDRTIHTKTIEALRGRECGVVSLKRAYTGRRSEGYRRDEEGDYQPPYLGSMKAHTICFLDVPVTFDDTFPYVDLEREVGTWECRIEACHLRKVCDGTTPLEP